jgi:hypothetical protein
LSCNRAESRCSALAWRTQENPPDEADDQEPADEAQRQMLGPERRRAGRFPARIEDDRDRRGQLAARERRGIRAGARADQ